MNWVLAMITGRSCTPKSEPQEGESLMEQHMQPVWIGLGYVQSGVAVCTLDMHVEMFQFS